MNHDHARLKNDLRSFTHPGPNDDNSRSQGIKVMEHALRVLEEQEEFIADLVSIWKDESCWRQASVGPCGTCKACRTKTALFLAGLVPPPDSGPPLFDLFDF